MSSPPSVGTVTSPVPTGTPVGGRVQPALNVSDLDAAVVFYTKLFGVRSARRRPRSASTCC